MVDNIHQQAPRETIHTKGLDKAFEAMKDPNHDPKLLGNALDPIKLSKGMSGLTTDEVLSQVAPLGDQALAGTSLGSILPKQSGIVNAGAPAELQPEENILQKSGGEEGEMGESGHSHPDYDDSISEGPSSHDFFDLDPHHSALLEQVGIENVPDTTGILQSVEDVSPVHSASYGQDYDEPSEDMGRSV